MTLTPGETEALKYFGAVLFTLLSGATGAHIHKRRSAGWDENKDTDRRVPSHTHGDNGKPKLVPQPECDLRHETEKERWRSLLKNYDSMKDDIKGINEQLRG